MKAYGRFKITLFWLQLLAVNLPSRYTGKIHVLLKMVVRVLINTCLTTKWNATSDSP